MSLSAFVEQENGNLKFLAETEDEFTPDAFIEALLEEAPKQQKLAEIEAFIVLDTDAGTFVIVENVEEEVPATVRRVIRVAGQEAAAEEEEAPKPKRQTAKAKGTSVKAAAANNRAQATAQAKARTTAKAKGSATKAATGTTLRRRGGFKRNAASDD